MNKIYLLGAYGRVYKNFDIMRADFQAGKDFKILNGAYCSIRDIMAIIELAGNDAHNIFFMLDAYSIQRLYPIK